MPRRPQFPKKKNDRRIELIEKDVRDKATPAEKAELEGLQKEFGDFIDKHFPLPIEPLEKLLRGTKDGNPNAQAEYDEWKKGWDARVLANRPKKRVSKKASGKES